MDGFCLPSTVQLSTGGNLCSLANMLELEDDFVTYKFQKPLTFREFVSVKKHNWKPCKTSHLLVSPLAAVEQL